MKPSIALAATALLSVLLCPAPPAAASPAAVPAAVDQADSGQPVTDAWITTKVKSELATTKGVSSTDISVSTSDGVVTLTGVLDSDLAVKKAVAAARSVKGVRDVDATGLKTKD